MRFYEINPLVEQIAHSQFTYLANCRSRLDIVLGDARRSLESEPPQQFDVLAVDAFSSDAIPVHLLTAEAFREYFRHLKPDGILAVHISNRYLNLEWVVRVGAAALGKRTILISYWKPKDDEALSNSDWMLVSSDPAVFDAPQWKLAEPPPAEKPRLRVWTDDYSNLLSILK